MTKGRQIEVVIKRYLKWYFFPFIYFLLTGLVCAYAWYTRPVPYRTGIKTVFKIISLNPTLILTAVITVIIIIDIILTAIILKLKKRSPEQSIYNNLASQDNRKSFWNKFVKVSISALGIVLIITGLSIAIWIYKPYLIFMFSTSKIEALEKKAKMLEDYVVKKNETLEKKKGTITYLHKDETRKNETPNEYTEVHEQVQTNVIEVKEPIETKIEPPKQVQKEGINKLIQQISEIYQKDAMKKTEALQKKAEGIGQDKKNWIIIPTALVDAPILEGIDYEKLSEGVCHIPESAVPGKGGNCILEGHNIGEFGWWRAGGPFNMLEILEQGIKIYVFYNGKKYVYKVKEKVTMDVDDPRLYNYTKGERLTLITCAASWNPNIYTNKRTVIIAYPF